MKKPNHILKIDLLAILLYLYYIKMIESYKKSQLAPMLEVFSRVAKNIWKSVETLVKTKLITKRRC